MYAWFSVLVCVCVCVYTQNIVADAYLFVECFVALLLSTLVAHNIPQLCSSPLPNNSTSLCLQEQKDRAKTFAKRLRKIFDNLEWMFLRGRVLKAVEQSSREFPLAETQTVGKTSSKKKAPTPKSVDRSLVHF